MKAMRSILAATLALSVLGGSLVLATPAGAHTVHAKKGAHGRTHGPKGSSGQVVIGLVTDIGGLNDRSFNHLAYVGLQRAAKQLGIKAEVEQSTSQADYIPNLRHFASIHASLTIAVGFLMANAVYTVAKQFPTDHFAIIDSTPQLKNGNAVILKNVKNLLFREQESGYLVGVIAGLMERQKVGAAKTNIISQVGGLNIPPVTHYMCGYIAGAKKVDPSIKVLSSFDQTFTDAGKANSIGLTDIAKGSSILFQVDGGAGLGYLRAAQAKGVYGIGVDADEDYLGSYVITSALKKVDVAVYTAIQSVVQHRFVGGTRVFGLASGATGYATDTHNVPASIKAMANSYAKKIASHQIVPPATCNLGA